jgi:hypothetical protein
MPLHVINEVTADPQIPIFKRKTTLTDAQIKALPTTPVELVPAQGVGKMIKFMGGILRIDTTAGLYTNDNAYNTFVGIFLLTANVNNAIYFPDLNAGDDRLCNLAPLVNPDGANPTAFLVENVYAINAVENMPLTIKSTNTGGNFTGGDPANTLEVTVYYSIVDL